MVPGRTSTVSAICSLHPKAHSPIASVRTLRDRITIDFEMPRTRHLGVALALEAGYTELNVDAATGSRDVNTRDVLSFSVPVSPDGEGRILLTPEASVTFTGAYRGAERSIGEAELLFTPWPGLLLVPLTWSRTLQHAAADPFVGDPRVEAASNAVTATARTRRPDHRDGVVPAFPGDDRAEGRHGT